jgi:membrane protease YdiL (CAAX protease family)
MNPFLSSDRRLRNGWRFLIAAFVFIFAESFANRLALAFSHPHGMNFEAWYRPIHVALILIAYSLMVRYIDLVPDNPLAAQGLGTSGPWTRDIVIGLLIGGGLVSLAVMAIAVLGSYSVLLDVANTTIAPAAVVFWVLATAAMLEEAAFRGYPFQRLVDGLAGLDRHFHLPVGTGAIVVLSILFGAGHLGNPHASFFGVLNTVLVGVLLSVAYLRTRALWLPYGIHLGWNVALGMVFGLPVSGFTMFSVLVKGTASGPKWLTGGDYGLEASLTGAVVILLGILSLLKWVPIRANQSVSGEMATASKDISSV